MPPIFNKAIKLAQPHKSNPDKWNGQISDNNVSFHPILTRLHFRPAPGRPSNRITPDYHITPKCKNVILQMCYTIKPFHFHIAVKIYVVTDIETGAS